MDLLEGVKTRRSTRAFKPDPVPREIIEKILEAAGRSPSYTNTQPWRVAVVSGKKKEEISKILYEMAKSNIPPAPDIALPKGWPPELEARSREHGARRLQSMGVERGDTVKREELRLANFKFYGAPCVLFLLMDRALTSWSIFDMGQFVHGITLAAHSLGLGTCIQASITNYPDAIRQSLGIPGTGMVLVGVSLGYPDPEAPINSYRSSRVSLDDFVDWYS